ncbi:MAG: PH domain-containing protein [Candidatus Bathyarchaeota archaeon]|nr:PH domain-containing protein [Candidatus Bathyarchaeota archaeon]
MKVYSTASYDQLVKTVTFSLWIFLPVIDGIILFTIFSTPVSPEIRLTTGILLISITIIILGVTYLFSPKSYVLASNGVIIQRAIRSIVIHYDAITDVKSIDWTWKMARLGGSGGLYGYFGLFHIAGIGKTWMYVTNKDRVVYIQTKEKQYAISPDNADDFLLSLKQHLN